MSRCLLVLTFAVSQILQGVLPLPTDDQLLGLFGDYLESLRNQAGIPGLSAAIVGQNDIVWQHVFGQQDIGRSIQTKILTPFHLDGLTEVFTAAVILRCVEEGHLSLDDRIARFDPASADANATVRQVLTHTSGAPDALVFAYRPGRLAPLTAAVRACTGESFRAAVANLILDRFVMFDSVPGPDAIHLASPDDGIPASWVARYSSVLAGLATPYAVNKPGQASPSQYAATTLTAASGLISTVADVARFDLALRKGAFLRPDTLAAAWQPPLNRTGQPLPHGFGWFVQGYNGATVVWQFGIGENASSSLLVTVPARGLTAILLANSDGLVKPFGLAAGDLTASPFGRLVLGLLVR
jgi:CubicO group peptidase (beta-lactamase class C family)